MKAVRLFAFDQPPRLVDVPDPRIGGPLDVIVRIAGAGVCRTDLHLVEGVFKDGMADKMPFTLGHENAGWIEAVGGGVPHLATGDPVILHPQPSCGLCRNCRIGNDMHCTGGGFFPGTVGFGTNQWAIHNREYPPLANASVFPMWVCQKLGLV